MDGAARSAWTLLVLTLIVSCIPGIGFIVWFLGGVSLFVAFVIAIVVMIRGFAGQGIILLLATFIVAPLAFFVMPLLSTAALGMLVNPTPASVQIVKPQKTTPRPIPATTAATAAKARAVAKFPQLAVPNSPLNRAFLEAVRKAQTERPEVFDHPEWPSLLAGDAAMSL